MYRINILNYGNPCAKTGYRYCLTKRMLARNLVYFTEKFKCNCDVEKFIHCGYMWLWGDYSWEISEYIAKKKIKGF